MVCLPHAGHEPQATQLPLKQLAGEVDQAVCIWREERVGAAYSEGFHGAISGANPHPEPGAPLLPAM